MMTKQEKLVDARLIEQIRAMMGRLKTPGGCREIVQFAQFRQREIEVDGAKIFKVGMWVKTRLCGRVYFGKITDNYGTYLKVGPLYSMNGVHPDCVYRKSRHLSVAPKDVVQRLVGISLEAR